MIPNPHSGEKPRPLVLLVEDDAAMRLTLAAALTDEGYAIAEAGDGEAALRWVEKARPDGVVLDLMLPVVSGWSFLEAYRALIAPASPPPVLVISSIELRNDYAASLGVQDYLPKPFDLDVFLVHVAALFSDGPAPAGPRGTPREGSLRSDELA